MRDPHDLYHQKPKFWQTFPSLTNKQRYTLCVQSKLESQGGFERKRGARGEAETSACAPNDFPSNRGDILRGVGWHLQWNPDRTRSPTICLNDISGIYGSAVPRTCFRVARVVPALALLDANPRIQRRPPPIQRRPRIGACCIPSLGSLASRDLIGPVVFSTVTFRGTSKCPIPARRTFFWPISYRDKRNAWFRFSFCCKILKFLHSSVLETRADLFNLPVSIGRNLEENLYWYFETK